MKHTTAAEREAMERETRRKIEEIDARIAARNSRGSRSGREPESGSLGNTDNSKRGRDMGKSR